MTIITQLFMFLFLTIGINKYYFYLYIIHLKDIVGVKWEGYFKMAAIISLLFPFLFPRM